MDILYLDDYINFYNKNTLEITKIISYKDTLRNGIIINKTKFIKKMIKELNKIGIKNSIFTSSIKVIINNYYTCEDKELIKLVMEELNYKKVEFIHENNYLELNKNNVYLNCNYSYFYILYVDSYGDTKINMYKNDILNKSIFINLIDYFNNKNIILYGKNIKEFISVLDKYNIEYYVYEEKDNLIMKKVLVGSL